MSKRARQLTDTGQARLKHLFSEMIKLQLHVVTVRTATATFQYLKNHRARDHVTTSQIFSIWRITLHKALAVSINQVTTLTTTTLGNQSACTIDTGWVELPHFHVLDRHTCSQSHAHTITRVNVCIRRRGVDTARTTRCENGCFGFHVDGLAGLNTNRDNTDNGTVLILDKISREPFIEEYGLVFDVILIKRVQQRMTGTVSRRTRSRSLAALTEIL